MAIGTPVAGTLAENATAATSLAVPHPTGISAGDLLLLWVAVSVATVPNLPAGWTSVVSGSSGSSQSPAQRVYYKVATGSETGNQTVTMSNSTSRGQMWRISGVDQTTPIDVVGTHTAAAIGGALTHPGVTTTVTGCQVWAFAMRNATSGTWTTITSPFTMTEALDDGTPYPTTQVSYLTWSGSGATGTVTFGGDNTVRAGYDVIALRPAVPGLNGTSAAVSDSAGTLDISRIYGTSAAVSAVAGTVSVSQVSGTAPATSGTSGTVSVSQVSGTVAATSATSGSLPPATIAGLVPAVSAAAGTLDISTVAGVLEVTSATVGTVESSLIDGTVSAVSAVVGLLSEPTPTPPPDPLTLTFLFTPPGRVELFGDHPLFGRLPITRGVSLLKEGTTYRQVEDPSAEEVEAADAAYLGGHVYTINGSAAADLDAAGYGAWLTQVGFGSGIYGSGIYGGN